MQELYYLEDTVIEILSHFNMTSLDSLFKNDSSKMLIQKTSVLSYYILKYGLLLRTNMLLTTFYPGVLWNRVNIEELYSLSVNALKQTKLNHQGLNLSSMKMSYNQLVYR
jgi:hypothetical protein